MSNGVPDTTLGVQSSSQNLSKQTTSRCWGFEGVVAENAKDWCSSIFFLEEHIHSLKSWIFPNDDAIEVIKNCQQISSRVAVLILRAKQESPATLALVLDAIMSRMVNEDGVIYKEDRLGKAANS